MDAFTTSCRPARNAVSAMMSSAALPKVALEKPADAFAQVLGEFFRCPTH